MTANAVIEEIEQLPPDEQSRVIRYAMELARKRQLSEKNWANLPRKWPIPMILLKLKD
jgi:hypothetical protein